MSHLLIVSKVLKFVKSLKTNKNVTLLMPSGFRSFNDHLGQMEGLSHLQETEFTSTEWQGGREGHSTFREQYQKYKEEYVKQLQFDSENFGKMSLTLCLTQTISKNILVEHSPLEEVYIFFDTTTYDEIERDVKVMFAPYWSAGSYLLMF